MYIGAAGDFHPLDQGHAYAIAQGYPSPFAPGMLTMALNGQAITKNIKQDAIRRFDGRFRAQVWPSDLLETEVKPAPYYRQRLLATTTNQHRTAVFEGWVDLHDNHLNFL